MALMRGMRSPEGAGNCLLPVKGCVPVAEARFGGSGRPQSGRGRRGQAPAGIVALSTQMHGPVVWAAGRPGCRHRCGGPGAALVLTRPSGARMLLAATGGSRSAPVDLPLWAPGLAPGNTAAAKPPPSSNPLDTANKEDSLCTPRTRRIIADGRHSPVTVEVAMRP